LICAADFAVDVFSKGNAIELDMRDGLRGNYGMLNDVLFEANISHHAGFALEPDILHDSRSAIEKHVTSGNDWEHRVTFSMTFDKNAY